MKVSVYTKKIKTEKGNAFTVYSCKDKEGNFYDVRFTKNSGDGIKEPAIIEVADKDMFVTKNEGGYKTLVINGPYKVVEPIELKSEPLPTFA